MVLCENSDLKKNIEKTYDIKITDESLVESIELYNYNRKLMREINELRLLDSPKQTGSEALKISMANTSVPKEIAKKELERLLERYKDKEGIETQEKKRILLLGSVVDNTQFTQLIEDANTIIISDNFYLNLMQSYVITLSSINLSNKQSDFF